MTAISYRLSTRRISEGTYRHELFVDGEEINIDLLPSNHRETILTIGRNYVRALEYLKEKGIRRDELEASLKF